MEATTVWSHSYNNRAEVFLSSKLLHCSRGILQVELCKFVTFVDLLRDMLTTRSIFLVHVKDHAAKVACFANNFILHRSLQISLAEIKISSLGLYLFSQGSLRIWLEQCGKTTNSVLEGMANHSCTA